MAKRPTPAPGKGERTSYRCAIYTRKSSEEGLEQGFNSLEAQREACEAYIRSQAHEGWRLLPRRYDDGGFSGGTLERPALQALLEEVKARRIDVIVLYKIDRLTRSLTDFAKLAELLDEHGVSFVSVTQQFNTTTSMGRLMLNVLLSFAQFEREITGERIRDKIAASKQKGMWMGGFVPVGYDAVDRTLVINEAEAETVRTLFQLYLKEGTVEKTQAAAERLGLRSKARPLSNGRMGGGKPFSRGHLYRILQNPIYIGQIAHQGKTYPGTHPALIDKKTWEAVQERIAKQRIRHRRKENAKEPSLLAGLLYTPKGIRYTPTHAIKKGQRYRYYVAQPLPSSDPAGNARPIPATQIEGVVCDGVNRLLKERRELIRALGHVKPQALEHAAKAANAWATALASMTPASWREALSPILQRVVLHPNHLQVLLERPALRSTLGLPRGNGRESVYEWKIPVEIRRRGVETRLVTPGPEGINGRKPDETLIKLIARAHRWAAGLRDSIFGFAKEIARQESVYPTYIDRVLPLAFLAPELVEDILAGRQPVDLTTQRLLNCGSLPDNWTEQRQFLYRTPVNTVRVEKVNQPPAHRPR